MVNKANWGGTLVEEDVGILVIAEQPRTEMRRAISTHVYHTDAVAALGRHDEIRLHLQRVGRRGQAVADINATIIVHILHRACHLVDQGSQHRVAALSTLRCRLKLEEPFTQLANGAQQTFLRQVVHLREHSPVLPPGPYPCAYSQCKWATR